jgi:hypothetical protein
MSFCNINRFITRLFANLQKIFATVIFFDRKRLSFSVRTIALNEKHEIGAKTLIPLKAERELSEADSDMYWRPNELSTLTSLLAKVSRGSSSGMIYTVITWSSNFPQN